MTAEWNGPTCLMCNGTGKDCVDITKPRGIFREVVGFAELDSRCRARNGHGRDPSDPSIRPGTPPTSTPEEA